MKRSGTYILKCFITGLLTVLCILPGSSGTAFDQGNARYKEQRYAESVKCYQEAIRSEGKNSVMYYNLGNAYFRLKKYPEAVLYYEKTLKHDPSNAQAAFNLKLARDKALTKIESSSEFFVVRFLRERLHQYGARTWSVIFLVLFWAGTILLLLWFRQTPGHGTGFRRSGITLLVFALGAFAMAGHRHAEQTGYHDAVVMRPGAELKMEPVAAAETKSRIEAGNKVELLDRDAAWYKIKLPGGKTGWISAKDIVLI